MGFEQTVGREHQLYTGSVRDLKEGHLGTAEGTEGTRGPDRQAFVFINLAGFRCTVGHRA